MLQDSTHLVMSGSNAHTSVQLNADANTEAPQQARLRINHVTLQDSCFVALNSVFQACEL